MKSDMKSWSDLRVFLAVARAGSTLAASKSLGMAQPTVARRIEALEHELGQILFERDTRGFHMTEAAKAIRPMAEAMEQAAQTLRVKIEEIGAPRPIRITAFVANFNDQVAEIMNEFALDHPEIGFEFLPSMGKFDLIAGEADIALRLSFVDEHPDLISRHISTAQFALFGAASYAEKFGLPSCPEDMPGHRLLVLRRDDVRPIIYNWFRRYVSEDQITRVYAEPGLLDTAVRTGQGLGINNLRMAEKDEAAGRLVRCFDPIPEITAKHQLLVSPSAWRRPEVKTFVRFFAPRYAALYQ